MSNELLNLVWPLRIGSAPEKAVLVTLADACGAADACSMVAETIAYRTDYTARAVKNFLHGLEAKGLIVICERPGRASEFWVNRSALEAWDKSPTWLKNQQLKMERAEKLKARAPAPPAPARPAPAPPAPAQPAPAPAAPVDAATATLMMLDAQTKQAAKPSPEIRAKIAALRGKPAPAPAAPAPAPAVRNVIKLEDAPEPELRGSA